MRWGCQGESTASGLRVEPRVSLTPPGPAGAPDAAGAARAEAQLDERYSPVAVLGSGGMGQVLVLKDREIGREVAAKFQIRGASPEASSPASSVDRTRFLREATIQARLEHPSIVPVYDVSPGPSEEPYFTMRRVRGVTLQTVLHRLRRRDAATAAAFPRRKLLAAFGKVCLAVAFAHERGIVHRDLKPANIMLGDSGETYVLDWGIACVEGKVTGSSRWVGTPSYMAPEQLTSGSGHTAACDIYALGAVLFEILTLEQLHPGMTRNARLAAACIAEGATAGAPMARRDVPEALAAICKRATAHQPEDRFPSLREMHAALEQYLDSDRGLELQRSLAEEHLAAAAAELEDAARGPPSEEAEHRSRAIERLGRTLALNPDDPAAMTRLIEVLEHPPRQLPEAVEQELAERYQERRRRSRSVGAAVYAGLFLFLPLASWAGLGSWPLLMAAALAGVIAVATLVTTSQEAVQSARPGLVAFGSSLAAMAILGRVWGPFFHTPAMLVLNACPYILTMNHRFRRFIPGLTALVVFAPVALEATGVLPASYAFRGDQLCIAPQLMRFAGIASEFVLLSGNLSVVAGGGIFAFALMANVREAQARVLIYGWRLRSLLAGSSLSATTLRWAAARSAQAAPAETPGVLAQDPAANEGPVHAMASPTAGPTVLPTGRPTVAYEPSADAPCSVDPADQGGLAWDGIGERFEKRYVAVGAQTRDQIPMLDRRIGRAVTVQLPASGPTLRAAIETFLAWVRLQGRLEHPAVVPIYDVGMTAEGLPYAVMRQVQGTTLLDTLRRRNGGTPGMAPSSRRRLLEILAEVCGAIAFAHARGVKHGHLNASNVLLGDYGETYVLDWSRAVQCAAPGDQEEDVRALGELLRHVLDADEREPPPELEALATRALEASREPGPRCSAEDMLAALDAYLDGARDLDLRRTLADRLLARADQALEGARTSELPEVEVRLRAEATGALHGALAFDPTAEPVRRRLFELLLDQPRSIPPEVDSQLQAIWLRQFQQYQKVVALAYAAGFIALCWVAGSAARDMGNLVATQIFCALTVVTSCVQVGLKRLPIWLRCLGIVLSVVTLVLAGRQFGPLLLTPTLLAVIAIFYGGSPIRSLRIFGVVSCVLATVVPAVLEWTGVIARSYAYAGGEMCVVPQAIRFSPATSLGELAAANGVMAVLVLGAAVHLRRWLRDSEERAQLYTWHLRQLVPADASDASRGSASVAPSLDLEALPRGGDAVGVGLATARA